jgi:hypothetical protein
MATAVALDAHNLSFLQGLPGRPGADHVVVFLNLASASNGATVAAVEALGLNDGDEVVLCDEWPEAADLAILSWRAANASRLIILTPITGDRGLSDAFSKGFVPPNGDWRQRITGPGVVSARAGNGANLEELLSLLAVPDWARAEAATAAAAAPAAWPWWARLAAVLRVPTLAPLRAVFPLGFDPDPEAVVLRNAFRSVLSGRSVTLPRLTRLMPEWSSSPPLGHLRVEQAFPGLAQWKAGGSTLAHGWVSCRHHSPQALQQAARRMGRLLSCRPDEIEGALAAYAASAGLPALRLPAVHAKILQIDRDTFRIATKGLDFHAYPSRDCRETSLWGPVREFLARSKVSLKSGTPGLLTLALVGLVRNLVRPAWLTDWTIVRDWWLLWNRRGASAFCLKPGDNVQVVGGVEVFQREPSGSGLIALVGGRPRPDGIVLGLVTDQPSVVALLADAARELCVTGCISPVVYHLRLPSWRAGGRSRGRRELGDDATPPQNRAIQHR